MAVVTNNPFKLRSNYSNNIDSSPLSHDTESVSTTQDEDFKNIDRSSSFQTSTSSPTLGSHSTIGKDFTSSMHHRSNTNNTINSNDNINHNHTMIDSDDEVDQANFYSAPSFNDNGIINYNHANHFRKSMIISESLMSINSELSNTASVEIPTKKLGIANSPSITALGAILTSKSKSSLTLSNLASTVEEDEEEEDTLEEESALQNAVQHESNLVDFSTEPTIYNQPNNHSVATFYSALSSKENDSVHDLKSSHNDNNDDALQQTPSYVIDNSADLISLSSTIKDTVSTSPISPYKQESIGKADIIKMEQVSTNATPIIDSEMTPRLFSPAMVFTQPVEGLQILVPSALGAPSTSQYSNLAGSNMSENSSYSISPKKIGYESGSEMNSSRDLDTYLVDLNTDNNNIHGNLYQQKSSNSSKPEYSIRMIDDFNDNEQNKENELGFESQTKRNSLFDTPTVPQTQSFTTPVAVAPKKETAPLSDSPSVTTSAAKPKATANTLGAQSMLHVKSKSASLIDIADNSTKKLPPIRPLTATGKAYSSQPDTNSKKERVDRDIYSLAHKQNKSDVKVDYNKKSTPPTPVIIQADFNNEKSHKKFGFKSLFKSKKSDTSKKEKQAVAKSPQLSTKSKSPRLSFGMPSPALSNHSKSKSFSAFGRSESQNESTQVQQSSAPTPVPASTATPVLEKEANLDSKTKSSDKKEKRKSTLLSGWKRKSFTLAKEEPQSNVASSIIEKKKDQDKPKRNIFGKSKSTPNIVIESEKEMKSTAPKTETKSDSVSQEKFSKKQSIETSTTPSLLDAYGFNSASAASTPDLNVVFSSPGIPINHQYPTQSRIETEQSGTYIVPNKVDKGYSTVQGDVQNANLLTPQRAQFVEPFDEYQIELANFTPSPVKKHQNRRSLAPHFQGTRLYQPNSVNPSSVSSGLKIDFNNFELPDTPQLRTQYGYNSNTNKYNFNELQFNKAATTTTATSPSSPRVHAGDSIFPKSLDSAEVESIMTLERSKSVKSARTSYHNTTGASIVELMHDDVSSAVTSDGMVIVRSDANTSNLASPRSSKRASILKTPTKSRPHSRNLSMHSDYNADLNDSQLTDLIAMFNFSDGNVIDTDFNLDMTVESNMLSFHDVSEIESQVNKLSMKSLQDPFISQSTDASYESAATALGPSPLPHLRVTEDEIKSALQEPTLPLAVESKQESLVQLEDDESEVSQDHEEFSFSYEKGDDKEIEFDYEVKEPASLLPSPLLNEPKELNDLLAYEEEEEEEIDDDEDDHIETETESVNQQLEDFLSSENNRMPSSVYDYDVEEQSEPEMMNVPVTSSSPDYYEREVEETFEDIDDFTQVNYESDDPFSSIPSTSYKKVSNVSRRDSLDSLSDSESIRFTETPSSAQNRRSIASQVYEELQPQFAQGQHNEYEEDQAISYSATPTPTRPAPPVPQAPLQFKGLKGPSFNHNLKASTRSAILGSIANSTSSRASSLSIPPTSQVPKAPTYDESDYDDVFAHGNNGYSSATSPSPSQPHSGAPSISSKFSTKVREETLAPPAPSAPPAAKPKTLKKKGYSLTKSRDSLSSVAKLNMFTNKSPSATDLDSMIMPNKQGVKFSSRILLYDTYSEEEYDRHPEIATCNQLTPLLAQQIKDELNEFKAQMFIHEESRCNTQFF